MPFATGADGIVPTQLRGLAYLALSESGTVLNLSGTSDGGGGGTLSWTAGSAMPCRVDTIRGGEGLVAERIDDRTTHLIRVPPETSVGHEDRFAVANVGTFEITAVQTRTREWTRTLEAVQVN